VHRLTTPYNPKANGLTERANGIIGKILSKVVSAHKTDWDYKLASAVFAYNTAEKTTTGKSPYYLVYGQEPLSILGIELTTVGEARPLEEMEQARFDRIESLEEDRMLALEKTMAIQKQRKRRFDKKIRNEDVQENDLALVYDSRHQKFLGKLHVRWLGPYLVTKVYENGSLSMSNLDGEPLPTRINGSRVRKYHEFQFDD